MKKLGMLLMLFSLCVFTVGCGGGDGITETTEDVTTEVDDTGGDAEVTETETTETTDG